MARIFICHSSRDKRFARQLYRDLTLIGHTPWIDCIDLLPGGLIPREIEDALEECQCIMVILSPFAVESGWVEAEWQVKYMEALRDPSITIVPVLKKECKIPPFLAIYCYADFTKGYVAGFRALVATLKSECAILKVPEDIVPRNYLDAIENSAKSSPEDHVRIACAHTVWSIRPDRAKPILEDALRDWRGEVSHHAEVLLDAYRSGR